MRALLRIAVGTATAAAALFAVWSAPAAVAASQNAAAPRGAGTPPGAAMPRDAATPPGVAAQDAAVPPQNLVTFTNLALMQNLALRGDGSVVTAPPGASLTEVWDMVYITDEPTQPDFSSPYLLRNRATGLCLQDGAVLGPVPCQPADATQLWQHHRVVDQTVDGRDFYYRFSRSSGHVLTAQHTAVVMAPAEPVSKSGAAAPQLWRMLPA